MSTPSPDHTEAPPSRELTPGLLRSWPLPATSGSKYGRGQVLIVGGAATTPGAVQADLGGLLRADVGGGPHRGRDAVTEQRLEAAGQRLRLLDPGR